VCSFSSLDDFLEFFEIYPEEGAF